MAEFLDNELCLGDKEKYALVGYKAINTITDSGSVKRGVCKLNNNLLLGLDESLIEKTDLGLKRTSLKTNIEENIGNDTLVSMNLLGFPKKFLGHIVDEMTGFMEDNKNDMSVCEYLIPDVITKQIETNKAEVEILETDEKWYGITYKEDKEYVVKAIREMIKVGIYEENLWK